jgi:hypothetical protein
LAKPNLVTQDNGGTAQLIWGSAAPNKKFRIALANLAQEVANLLGRESRHR